MIKGLYQLILFSFIKVLYLILIKKLKCKSINIYLLHFLLINEPLEEGRLDIVLQSIAW